MTEHSTIPAELEHILIAYLDGAGEDLTDMLARGVNVCACGATIAPWFDLCAVCAVGDDEACNHIDTNRWPFTDGAGIARTVCTACGDVIEDDRAALHRRRTYERRRAR